MEILNLKKTTKKMPAAIPVNTEYVYFAPSKPNTFLKSFEFTDVKRLSTIKKVIEISTNDKSVIGSKLLLEAINDIIDNKLPTAYKNIKVAKANLNNIKILVSDINNFFSMLDNALGCNYDEVIIDDKKMNSLIKNMELAKVDSVFILSYLNLIIEVNTFKKAKKEHCSLDEFLEKIDQAA